MNEVENVEETVEISYWEKISLPLTRNLSHKFQRRLNRAARNGGNYISAEKKRRKR